MPLLFDLDIGLVDAEGIVRRFQPRPAPLLQFGGIALDPTKDRGMIDGHTAVVQQFFDIAIAQGIAEILADGTENDLGFKMARLEW